ncbi:hypothetical protein KIPB_009340, partial [Kipferlia bialata]
TFFLVQYLIHPLNYLIYMRFIRYYPDLIKNLRKPLFDDDKTKREKEEYGQEHTPLVAVPPPEADFQGLLAVNFWYFFLSSAAYLSANTVMFTVTDDPDEGILMFCLIVMVVYHVTLIDNLIGIEGGTLEALSKKPSNQILADDVPFLWQETSAPRELVRVGVELALMLTGPCIFFVSNLDTLAMLSPSLLTLADRTYTVWFTSFVYDNECLMLVGALCMVTFTCVMLGLRLYVAVTTVKKRSGTDSPVTFNRQQFMGEVGKVLFVTLFYLASTMIYFHYYPVDRETSTLYPVAKSTMRFVASTLTSLVYLVYSAARSYLHAFDCPPINLSFILYSASYMVTNFFLAVSIENPHGAVMMIGFIMYHVLILEQCMARQYQRVPREGMWAVGGDFRF